MNKSVDEELSKALEPSLQLQYVPSLSCCSQDSLREREKTTSIGIEQRLFCDSLSSRPFPPIANNPDRPLSSSQAINRSPSDGPSFYLPPEILHTIAGYLPTLVDLKNVRLVCKYFAWST